MSLTSSNTDWAALGAAIRERRRSRGLTLVELAGLVELSQPFLSQIENGRARPSMESLYRIAHALGTTPQALFGGVSDNAHAPSLARGIDAPTLPADDRTGSVCHLLLAGDAPLHVLEYDGLPTEFRDYWDHDGFEAAYVIHGTIELDLDGTVTVLGPGDLLSYPARTPHRLRAVGRARPRVLLIETASELGAAARALTVHRTV